MGWRLNFEELQKKAIVEWESIEHGDKFYIIIGTATCGRAAGALEVIKTINEELTKRKIEATIIEVGCIGICHAEPLVNIIKPGRPHIYYGNVTPKIISELIEDYIIKDNPRPDLALGTMGNGNIEGIPLFWELPMLKSQMRIILRNCGIIDPERIEHYIARGGYSALVKVFSMTPAAVIEEIKRSGLRGRGGAGFPTGQKWEFCRQTPGSEKYIICNADEGDPGAFMDRSLLEGDPHSVLEGMLIAAYAIGAAQGYIYVRAEYPLAVKRLRNAVKTAEQYGFLGTNILDSGFSFTLEIKEGAGAFVCGEETALIASLEGKRGMPRPRPPFPAQSGFWGRPTTINNVKTLAAVPVIIMRGADWFASIGTEKSKGTAVFALTGKVKNCCLIEVPMGTTIRSIVFDIGGGIPNGKCLKAVQTGGPSGGCIPAEMIDLPVDYESLTQVGSMMGSGGMIVMDEDTCMVDVAHFFLSFTQFESCGKCPPCRVGTREMFGILQRITRGQGKEGDIEQLQRLAETVRDGSLCAFGGTAPNPVLTTLRHFQDEYEEHIKNKRCPALVCKELILYYIIPDKCQGCMLCLKNCPVEAIKGERKMVHIIDQEKCTKCGSCLEVCPPRFAAVVKVSGERILSNQSQSRH